MFELRHYGKPKSELNEKELLLLFTDLLMTETFEEKRNSENEIEKKLIRSMLGELTKKRVRICCEIFEYKIDNEEELYEFMEFVETTDYSYRGFLEDYRRNIEKINTLEKMSELN